MGKTGFSQLTPFDFISVLILGELLGNAVYDKEVSIWQILFATVLWALLIYGSMLVTQKFKRLRKTLEGEPSIIVRKGQIEYRELQGNKMDLNQLQSLIRQKGYMSVQEVEYAILETNGTLSVFPKPDHDTPKMKDLNLSLQAVELPITLILDGEIDKDSLGGAGVDEAWLRKELKAQNIRDPKQVLFAELNKDKKLFVMRYG